MRTSIVRLAILLLAAGLVAACTQKAEPAGGGGTAPAEEAPAEEAPAEAGAEEGGVITVDGESANDHGSEEVSGKTELALELDDSYFEPTILEGSAGQQLTLELENEGTLEHNFSIESQGIDVDVDPGGSEHAEVTFPDSGMLVFECEYHAAEGMRGALQVT